MEEINPNEYKNILQRLTNEQFIKELAIFVIQDENVRTKRKELITELKRRLRGN